MMKKLWEKLAKLAKWLKEWKAGKAALAAAAARAAAAATAVAETKAVAKTKLDAVDNMLKAGIEKLGESEYERLMKQFVALTSIVINGK
jgi:uncharacterized pyridoxal phosphate-containing UPF0001 family protein